jgi:hypothetical protein
MKQRIVAFIARKRSVCLAIGKWQAAVICVLVSSAPISAIDLPLGARIRNIGGYCTWASLDTVAHANGISRLRGVFQARRESRRTTADPGYDYAIEEELKSRGVRYELRRQFSYDRELLEKYAGSYGVVVSLKSGNPWSIGCHTILITSYDETTVEFYDSSKPVDASQQPKIWSCGRDWFDTWWLGSSVVIFPDDDGTDTQLATKG